MSSGLVFPLKCAVQTYAWGKPGSSSAVADLSKSGNPSFSLEETTPYAELWMGTHPKGPCFNANTSEGLSDFVTSHPECVGSKVREQFPTAGQLPFLFKVLSVNKSLSIQAHPNKSHAEQLHAERPDKYPDPNHKPEMAIALTTFEGLCGFRPREEIVKFFKDVPEFRSVVGDDSATRLSQASDDQASQAALQQCFTALMTCDPAVVAKKLEALVHRITEAGSKGEDTSAINGELLLRLNSQFPGDGGCFCIYFLNHMVLQPGEAMFLEANLPHAYLSGDCMECMACSDNVVRAGLTPKFKDVPTLCSMLNYTCKPAQDNLFSSSPHPMDACVTMYNPPIPDFTVAKIQLPPGTTQYTMSSLDSASILLVIQGAAQGTSPSLGGSTIDLGRGTVLFTSAGESVTLTVKSTDGMQMFRAYCQI